MTEDQELIEARLGEIARTVEDMLPTETGFILFAFDFGNSPERRMQYVSNANREDAMKAMLEWMDKTSNGKYGKHLD